MPIEVRQVMSGAAVTCDRAPTTAHERLLRELAPQVLGAVVRRYGDFAAAEDAVQEALIAAAMQWPDEGVPDNPRGVADPGRRAPHDRSAAQRDGAAPARERGAPPSRRTPTSRRRRRTRSSRKRRHAAAALHVLPSGAHAAVRDRAHAARRRWAHDGRDRERVPRARGDDGAAHQPREADDQDVGRAVRDADGARERGAAWRGAARALSDLQRRLREQQRRASSSAPICRPRRFGSRAWCTRCCRTTPRSRACSR